MDKDYWKMEVNILKTHDVEKLISDFNSEFNDYIEKRFSDTTHPLKDGEYDRLENSYLSLNDEISKVMPEGYEGMLEKLLALHNDIVVYRHIRTYKIGYIDGILSSEISLEKEQSNN